MGVMAALCAGEQAPDFKLSDADGKEFHLAGQLRSGPVLLTFFKTDCPTCQYGLPFLDRFARVLEGKPAETVAICQDSTIDAERFNGQFGYRTRTVFDTQEAGFPVSNAYGLTNVPTIFLIGQDGQIAHAAVSWSKADVEEVAEKLGVEPPFLPGESVLPFRPG